MNNSVIDEKEENYLKMYIRNSEDLVKKMWPKLGFMETIKTSLCLSRDNINSFIKFLNLGIIDKELYLYDINKMIEMVLCLISSSCKYGLSNPMNFSLYRFENKININYLEQNPNSFMFMAFSIDKGNILSSYKKNNSNHDLMVYEGDGINNLPHIDVSKVLTMEDDDIYTEDEIITFPPFLQLNLGMDVINSKSHPDGAFHIYDCDIRKIASINNLYASILTEDMVSEISNEIKDKFVRLYNENLNNDKISDELRAVKNILLNYIKTISYMMYQNHLELKSDLEKEKDKNVEEIEII